MNHEQAFQLQPEQRVDVSKPTDFMWRFCTVLVAALLVWLFTWYGDTTLSTVAIWYRSETYAHGYLIFPISAYLIWTRRREVLRIQPNPSAAGILSLIALGLLWLIGTSVEALVVSQYALVAMVPAIVWSVLGYRVISALLFPLLFLLFAVPVGDFLIAPMMNFTADFTVTALRITGIPVFREGNFFTVPSGNWSVVEACSGLRYLIASLTLGCLFSYLTYRSYWRRLVFIGMSIVVPILANGLRAYMIVMIGHLSNNRLATGVDHVIYGWVFFGFVMLLLFWIGSRWQEADETTESPLPNRSEIRSPGRSGSAKVIVFALVSAIVITIWPLYARHLVDVPPNPEPLTLLTPAAPEGWQIQANPLTDWEPHFLTAPAAARYTFNNNEKKVEVLFKYYRNQHQGAELINSDNQLVSTRNPSWGLTSDSSVEIQSPAGRLAVNESTLRSPHTNLLVWSWYWIGGSYTSNVYFAKLYQAKAKLLGQGDDAAAIFVYAPFEGKPDTARKVLLEFVPTMFPAIDKTLTTAKR
jgi:exosortase A